MADQTMDLYSALSLNISNCVTVTLTQKNYIMWKSQFEVFLSGQRLLGFVTGDTPKPPATTLVRGPNNINTEAPNPDAAKWEQTDQVVRSWFLGSFSKDILSVVVSCSTSQEVWVSLANFYNRVYSSRLFELQRKFQTISKLEKSMIDYLQEIKPVCDQLSYIGSPVKEKMKVFAALHGLSREYEPIKTSIEGSMDSDPSPTLDDVIPRLTAYEDRLQSYLTFSDISPHLAFNAIQASSGFYNNRGRGQTYHRGGRGRGSFSTGGRGFPPQLNSFHGSSSSSDVDSRPICQICGKKGHPALSCWHRIDNTYQHEDIPFAMAAMRITEVTYHTCQEWFPDTGASAHVTSSPHHLNQSRPYIGSDTVMIADGNFLPITHTGSGMITSSSGQGKQEVANAGKKP